MQVIVVTDTKFGIASLHSILTIGASNSNCICGEWLDFTRNTSP